MRSAVCLVLLSVPCAAQGLVLGSGNAGGYGGVSGSQTNNPVTMVFEHKQVQTLSDGTHITSITHESFYRDTLGRTRYEHESPLFSMGTGRSMRSVTVQDPVAQTMINWQAGDLNGVLHEYYRVETHHSPQVPRPMVNAPVRTLPTPRPIQSGERPMPRNTTEQLGTQDVQGVPCEATRVTTVYPVNFMGNDRPITSVNEFCNSREFGRNVSESFEDPRTGTRTVTLQSISRGEPDPSLFQPPPDYTERPQQQR